MLKEFEWTTINNILLELYTIDEIKTFTKKIMNVFHMLVTYSKGYLILLDEDQRIIGENTYFYGCDSSFEKKYLETYYEKDYVKYLYEFSKETIVFQDSSMIEDNVRENTDFYQNFLLPADIPYGVGILIVKDEKIIGIFNLFRSSQQGDFTERDIYILNVLKKHMENIVYRILKSSRQTVAIERCFENAKSRFMFSDREVEILKLIADGKSNNEICNQINVSISTVKKHIYNIFNKSGVNSRTQLLNLIYSIDSLEKA